MDPPNEASHALTAAPDGSAAGDHPAGSADPLEPYRRWATTLFTVMAIVGIAGIVVTLGSSSEVVVFWVLVGSVGLSVATYLAVAVSLRRGESWAVRAVAPICLVIFAASAIRVVEALGQNSINLPLDGIGALMVLGRNRPEHLAGLAAPGRRRVWLAVGAVVLAQVLPYGSGVLASGGPFGAQRESLDLRVSIDCTTVGQPGGTIPVRVAWSWRSDAVFAPTADGLVVRWNMTTSPDDGSSPGATVDDPVTMSHPGMWAGSDSPSAALIDPLADGVPSRAFGIDVSKTGLIDGSVELALRPAEPTIRHGDLEVWAAYAHGDQWLRQTDASTCSW